jgi:hypothetical protein
VGVGDRQIELEIGTIVVEGLGRIEEQALVSGVRTELVRLVSPHGLPDGLSGAAPTLRAPALEGVEAKSGGALGAAVARAVYGALSG